MDKDVVGFVPDALAGIVVIDPKLVIAHPNCPARVDINMANFKFHSIVIKDRVQSWLCELCGLEIWVGVKKDGK